MDLKDIIDQRRAYRSLAPAQITEALIEDLADCAGLAPSCFNNQPWRYIFVDDAEILEKMKEALSKGNEWAHAASMIIAVFSRRELDCLVKGREYFLFDTGMATANMILRATELGLVAHPIAGFNEEKAKEILNLPGDMTLITLLIVGGRSESIRPGLSDKQIAAEKQRPERLLPDQFIYRNHYRETSK
jgi:nitroreductase